MRVVVRFRPLNELEMQDSPNGRPDLAYQVMPPNAVRDVFKGIMYDKYDAVLGPESTQEDVYHEVGEGLVKDVLDGFNAGVFAYGQSGGGKSFSMMGKEGDLGGDLRGLLPRAVEALFGEVGAKNAAAGRETASVQVSMFELYQDKIYDLLVPAPDNPHHGKAATRDDGLTPALKISDRALMYVKKFRMSDAREVMEHIQLGTERRRYRPMPLNPVSSRSHAVVQVHLQQTELDGSSIDSSLFFIDLMGSEALVSELSATVKKETFAVNFDLLCLEKVVMALSRKGGGGIPGYRDCILTWALREVLGGNSKSAVLVTCSPHTMQHAATDKSMQFAIKCKGITRTVTKAQVVYQDREDMQAMIMSLQTRLASTQYENQELREKLTELAFQAPDAPAWMETMRHVNQDQDMPLQRGIPEENYSLQRAQKITGLDLTLAGMTPQQPSVAQTHRSTLNGAGLTALAPLMMRSLGPTTHRPRASREAVLSHLDVDASVVRRNVNSMFHSAAWPEDDQHQSEEETKAIAGWIIRYDLDQPEDMGYNAAWWGDTVAPKRDRNARRFLDGIDER